MLEGCTFTPAINKQPPQYYRTAPPSGAIGWPAAPRSAPARSAAPMQGVPAGPLSIDPGFQGLAEAATHPSHRSPQKFEEFEDFEDVDEESAAVSIRELSKAH